MADFRYEDADRPEAECPPKPTFMESLTGTPEPGRALMAPDDQVEEANAAGLPLALPVGRVAPLSPFAGRVRGHRRLATSLNLETDAGRTMAFRCLVGSDFDAEELLAGRLQSEIFEVRDWLCVDGSKLDEQTGKLGHFVRTILIGPGGERYSTGSDWVLSALHGLEAFKGLAPWKPPLNLRIVAQRSAAKRTFYTLDLI